MHDEMRRAVLIELPTILYAGDKLQKRWMALSLTTYCDLDQNYAVCYRGTTFSQAANAAESLLGNDTVVTLVRLTLQAFGRNNDQRFETLPLIRPVHRSLHTIDWSCRIYVIVHSEETAWFKFRSPGVSLTPTSENMPQIQLPCLLNAKVADRNEVASIIDFFSLGRLAD